MSRRLAKFGMPALGCTSRAVTMLDPERAKSLWAKSEEMVGERF